jgi:hypothetical protein
LNHSTAGGADVDWWDGWNGAIEPSASFGKGAIVPAGFDQSDRVTAPQGEVRELRAYLDPPRPAISAN